MLIFCSGLILKKPINLAFQAYWETIAPNWELCSPNSYCIDILLFWQYFTLLSQIDLMARVFY